MYRVALIQNESEMMRYSWADIRPMISALGYPFDGYTAENLDEFFARLDRGRYDAVVIASNACNDRIVLESLSDNVDRLQRFLEQGKGLLVAFQMKLAGRGPYPFLPTGLRVSATNRLKGGERPEEGELACGQGQHGHIALNYPHRIDLPRVREHCLNNDMVRGLYWTFLSAETPEQYVTILEDASVRPHRPLLLASRSDAPFRIVVTSLPLDWQMHVALWENVARFVVEGNPTIAVISKEGDSTFDYRFLVSTLEVKKLPFAEYTLSRMVPEDVPLDIHNSFVLDPAWSEDDVARFMEATSQLVKNGHGRVFSFSRDQSNLPLLQAASNVREYQTIARNALTWLVAAFPKDEEQSYWAGSFWCTVDVLRTLVLFDMPIAQYRDRILRAVYQHDQDGSYDEVLGASCAMLELYDLFLGGEHDRTQRCLNWIEKRVHNKTLFERATGYDSLSSLRIATDRDRLAAFKEQVMQQPELDNEFQIYRYAKTLHTCGFTKEAEELAMKLGSLQDRGSGKWVNVPHTASVVELLIAIRENGDRPNNELDEMVFRGVQFLRSAYTPLKSSWGSDIAATAKCLKALRAFERKLSYPVDVVITALQSSHEETLQVSALDVATSMNVELQKQVNLLHQKLGNLEIAVRQQQEKAQFAARLSAWFSALGTVGLILIVFFFWYAMSNDLMGSVGRHIASFMKEFWMWALPSIAVGSLSVLGYVLKRLDRLPRFIEDLYRRSQEKGDD